MFLRLEKTRPNGEANTIFEGRTSVSAFAYAVFGYFLWQNSVQPALDPSRMRLSFGRDAILLHLLCNFEKNAVGIATSL